MPNEIIETLQRAKRILQERGWAQRVFRDKHGRVCLVEAVASVGNLTGPEYSKIEWVLLNLVQAQSLSMWNDAQERTVEDVYALLDRAIEAEGARA